MDHAEAHARLMDVVLEPARLRGLDQDARPGSSELRAHIATCADCRSDLGAWQATVAALDTAVTTQPGDGERGAGSLGELAASAGAVALPPELRTRILSAARERTASPVHLVAAPRRPIRMPSWLALAAALVVVIGGATVVVDRTQQLDQARAQTAAINTVAAGLDHILQDPGHRVAQLTTSTGTPAGSVSWSASESSIVVITDALTSPPRARCIDAGSRRAGPAWW